MARQRIATPALSVAALLLCSCGPSGGGAAASSQPAASSAPIALSSAPAAASDTAPSSAAASALPPAPAAPPAPATARAAAPTREPTAAELLRNDPAYVAKARSIEALYENAKDRDPTGQVEGEQNAALAQLHACADRACLDTWFRRREAALRQYVQ